MTIFILDGYNVIHAVPKLRRALDRSLEAARHALVSDCRAFQSRKKSGQIYVVFDGAHDEAEAPRGSGADVVVMFTRKKEEADERILDLLRGRGGNNTFVIVSNDTYVFNNARAHGARVMSVAAFYAQLAPSSSRTATRAASPEEKTPLSLRDANRITDEYRRHLERGSR